MDGASFDDTDELGDGSFASRYVLIFLKFQNGGPERSKECDGPRSGLFGIGCKARCAVDSPAIDKRRNAADRPKKHLPCGLG